MDLPFTIVSLVPVLHRQKICDMPVPYAVPAEVEIIHGDYIFRKIILDVFIDAKFPLDGFFGGEEIRNLHIDAVSLLLPNKIDFLVSCFPDGYRIAPAEHFHEDHIFEDEMDVTHVSAIDGFPDAMIGNVIFLIGRENLLSCEVMSLGLIEKAGVHAVTEIVQNGFWRDIPPFTFQKFGDGTCGKCSTDVSDDISENPLEKIRIADFISFDNIF